jgi:peroxiredoxin
MIIQNLIMVAVFGLQISVGVGGREKGNITGQVIDVDGKPAVGADVAATWNADTGKMHPLIGARTDNEGRFSLPAGVNGQAFLALDKERKTGAVAFKGDPLNFRLKPLVKVHGSIFCKELNKVPPWTAVTIRINKAPFYPAVVQFNPKAKDFSFLLPPGTYLLRAHGAEVKDLSRELTLSEDAPDLDLKDVNLEATIIMSHVGKPLPPWKVTDARGAKKQIQLSDFKGKWVLIAFWGAAHATFNNSQITQFIDFCETRAKDRDKFDIILFHNTEISDFNNLDTRLKSAKEMYWGGRDLPFPILLDSTGQTFKEVGIIANPTSILIDPQGNVFAYARLEDLEAKLPVLPLKERVANALDRLFDFQFDDPTLDQALQTLSEMAKIPIRLDSMKLSAEGLAENVQLPTTIFGTMSLRSALNHLLEGLELGYRQDDEGLVVAPRKLRESRWDKLSDHQRVAFKRLEKKLDQKVNLNFLNKPLSDVARHLTMTTHDNFVLDPADRRAGLVDAKTIVNGSAQGIPLREALTQLLRPVKMGFVIRDEAVVLTYKGPGR